MKKSLSFKKTFKLATIALTFLFVHRVNAQTATTTTDSTKIQIVTTEKPKTTYPKTVGYLSFILPLETLQGGKTSGNFGATTAIGFI